MTLPVTGALAAPSALASPASAATTAAAARPASKAQDADLAKQAEGFERLLLSQLTKVLVDGAFPQGESASAATNAYRDVLPEALTDALMQGGGIGLGRVITEGRS